MNVSFYSLGFIKSIQQQAICYGLDEQLLFSGTGTTANNPTLPDIPGFAQFITNAIELFNDESLGILEQPQPRGYFAINLQAILHLNNLQEVFQRYVGNLNVFQNTLHHEFIVDKSTATYRVTSLHKIGYKTEYLPEFNFYFLYRLLCWIAKTDIPVESINLTKAAPQTSLIKNCNSISFNGPTHFNQPQNSLVFNLDTMRLPTLQGETDSLDFMANTVENILKPRYQNQSLSALVANLLQSQLLNNQQLMGLQRAAECMDMSAQTLRHRLRKEGVTFNQLKQRLVQSVAGEYLLQKNISVEQLSMQLGYAEPSSFIRAFKGWTGLTPLAYRKQHSAAD